MGDNAGMDWGETFRLMRRFFAGLAGRMLVIATAVVVTADALLLGASLGNFHDAWLRQRVDAAQIAALAMEAAPADKLAEQLERELLANAQVTEVALHRDETRVLTLNSSLPEGATMRIVDLRANRGLSAVVDGISVLAAAPGRHARILAAPRFESGSLIEVVLSEDQLKRDLGAHANRAFVETLVVSLLVGGVLYAALFYLFVRRVRRLTGAIEDFGKRPQDATLMMPAPHGDDELARAERALDRMGEEVRTALRQRERLAGLGAAVAKIAHDLRNSLAAAQLVSERLAGSEDPKVRQSAPRLARAIARASALAEAALRFGKADEPRPALRDVDVAGALDEAAGEALARHPRVAWRNAAATAVVRADPDNLHRILSNLIRNAAEAMTDRPDPLIRAEVARAGDAVAIDIIDNGPGVPYSMRDQLFQPFATAHRDSGVGLGLAIARELARAQGGDVVLAASNEDGSNFRVTLQPSAP
jgi:hypothetical protein